MNNQTLYYKDTVQRLYELIKELLGDVYTVFPAFPLTPPTKDEMPCVIVDRKTDGAKLGPTQTDNVTEVIDVILMRSLADSIGGQNPRTDAKRELEMLVQGQNPAYPYDYRSDTLYYLLRHYLSLLQTTGQIHLIDSDVQTNYDTGKLADNITNVAFAHIQVSTQRRVIVQNRQ